jgi:hypothetical protein
MWVLAPYRFPTTATVLTAKWHWSLTTCLTWHHESRRKQIANVDSTTIKRSCNCQAKQTPLPKNQLERYKLWQWRNLHCLWVNMQNSLRAQHITVSSIVLCSWIKNWKWIIMPVTVAVQSEAWVSADWLLGSWVRIPLKAWMFVPCLSVLSCPV